MKVLKFGGTSVANAENIKRVISILKVKSATHQLAVVVSALGGVTDKLLEAATLAQKGDKTYLNSFKAIKKRHIDTITSLLSLEKQQQVVSSVETKFNVLKNHLKGIFLLGEFSLKTKDKVVSYGELLSSFIITEALKEQVSSAVLKNSRDIIITDSNFTNANVNLPVTEKKIASYFKKENSDIIVLPGFISKSQQEEFTTLGRGGSDYTAALIAAAVNADILEIWTDVSGMYTANPKLVTQAYPIKEISYQEAMELSHFGAKVLYAPTIAPVLQKQIPTCIKNTFKPEEEGTLITKLPARKNGPVTGISHIENITLITLEGNGMVGVPGSAMRLLSSLSKAQISIIIITQASSEHSICLGIYSNEVQKAKLCVDEEFAYEIALKRIKPLFAESDLAIIAIVGSSMKSHQGISGKMFSALGKNNINVRAIAQGASERNISVVIASTHIKKALITLHNRFFEKQIKTLNLFIVGLGNVGSILLEQIRQQQKYLIEHLLLKINVVGISNSKKMIFNKDGIAIKNWKKSIIRGEDRTHEGFFDKVKTLNLSNSIFIDITANEDVASSYNRYLKESISVVACNKIACSSDIENYQQLKALSKSYGASFLFETNVGAGLPIISTLNNLVNSGDEIISIKAVLSGSLNFIFNNFNHANKFHDVVKQAQEEGYTEPDPRVDLSGVDVARKILILARESGFAINLNNVENHSFLPQASLKATSLEEFYETLKTHAKHFENLYQSAKNNNCQLKYVAEFSNGKAKVGLEEINKTHPFYNLKGKDNIVLFYTKRYPNQPLIIKGAGAGAEVTASGLFGDIITLGTN